MQLPEKLTKLISNAHVEVRNHKRRGLSLPTRKKIWLAMGDLTLNGNKAVFSAGHYRRTMVSIISAEFTLPIWEQYFSSTDPHRMLDMAKKYIDGQFDFDTAKKESRSFSGGLNNVQNFTDEQLNAVLVGHSSVEAVLTALYEAWCDPTGELDEELDSWDSSMFAAGAYANGFPWKDEGCDFDKLHEFWVWYLDEAVPQAYNSYN
jgi:hypothetical protein